MQSWFEVTGLVTKLNFKFPVIDLLFSDEVLRQARGFNSSVFVKGLGRKKRRFLSNQRNPAIILAQNGLNRQNRKTERTIILHQMNHYGFQ